jgi:hypothetical protein
MKFNIQKLWAISNHANCLGRKTHTCFGLSKITQSSPFKSTLCEGLKDTSPLLLILFNYEGIDNGVELVVM